MAAPSSAFPFLQTPTNLIVYLSPPVQVIPSLTYAFVRSHTLPCTNPHLQLLIIMIKNNSTPSYMIPFPHLHQPSGPSTPPTAFCRRFCKSLPQCSDAAGAKAWMQTPSFE